MLVIAVCALGVGIVDAQDRSLVWEQWNVEIENVDPVMNRFDVTEDYRIAFRGTFRFGTVVIPADRLEEISAPRIVVDGVSLDASCNGEIPGTFCFWRQSGEYNITYYFPRSVTNATAAIQFRYTVTGALRVYESGDQLWWDAIPEEHFGFPIRSATVTVQLPNTLAPRANVDPIMTYGAAGSIEVSGSRVIARAVNGVGANEAFSVRVQYPHTVNARQASWQADFDAARAFQENVAPLLNVLICGLSLLIGGGVPLLVYTMWRTRGRDPQVGTVPQYVAEPPSALPPGLVGTLLDENAEMRDILATLIDLARRGYLVIEEDKDETAFGMIQNSTFTFKRTDLATTDLRQYEQRLIDSIFSGAYKVERSLASLRNQFYTSVPKIKNDLYAELLNEKLFAVSPEETRTRWGCGGLSLFFAGVLSFFVIGALAEQVGLIFLLPLALILAGGAVLVLAKAMPAKTQNGALEAAKWNAFREYLRNVEKYTSVEEAAARFEAYLPYAIAFDLDQTWLRRFRQVDDVPMPPWYIPVYRGGMYRRYIPGTPYRPQTAAMGNGLPSELARAGGSGSGLDDLSGGLSNSLESLSTGLTTMLNSASSVFTSVPQSSGSGSWSGGGRSFSGGGFSGGGGSGGGSRGFG
jgi:uncharacterized membrane protein YgcG